MSGYTKLFNSILASTIWRATDAVRVVWITMLAMADKHGIVETSVPGLADMARVPVAKCRAAVKELMAPDPDSRSQEFEGRRIEPVDGGFLILNHAKYRAKMNADDRREYKRKKEAEYRAAARGHRVDNRGQMRTNVDEHGPSGHNAEAEADLRSKPKIKITPRLRAEPVPAGQQQPKPRKNPAALVKLVHTVIDDNPDADPNDLPEQVKRAASRAGFDYVSGEINIAIDTALAQRRRGPGRPAKPRAAARRIG